MEKGDVREIMSGNIWGKLEWLLTPDSLLPPMVHNNIRYLKEEQSSMQAVLNGLSLVEDRDPAVTKWMNDVRDLAFDLEDCIDIFMYRCSKPSTTGVTRFIHRLGLVRGRHDIIDEVQRLKAVARDLNETRESLPIVAPFYNDNNYSFGITNRQHIDPDHPSIEENQPVGLEEDKKKLLLWLNDQNATLRVISLVGEGGMGKTTLASATYKDLISSGNFQSWAFVIVPQPFEPTELLEDLVSKVTQSKIPSYMDNSDADQFGSCLSDYLGNKRYVVVLDDICSTDDWTSIERYLPDSNNGSRIIITTPEPEVARRAGPDFIHELTPLNVESSTNLLTEIIFNAKNNYPQELEEIYRSILKKCHGFPLTMSMVVYLLDDMPKTVEQWKKVDDKLSSDNLDSVLPWLVRQSILNLPSDLKACVLYLSEFPKDYRIERTRLIRKWIAEGFVREMRGMCVEDVAEMYFDELIRRNIVRADRDKLSGKVLMCRIPDLMRDCIVRESEEENFLFLANSPDREKRHEKIRRLSFHNGTPSIINDRKTLSRVRSLTGVSDVGKLLMLTRMRSLRVLELDGCRNLKNHHLKHICKSLMLKYLSMRRTNVSILPREIGKLQFLQTMDIRETMIQKLPLEIFRLPYLLNLLAWGLRCDNESKDEPKEGISLSRNPSILYEISTSTQLQELRVIIDSEEKEIYLSLFAALEKMSKCLRSLLIWDGTRGRALRGIVSLSFTPLLLEKIELKGYLGRLPDWFLFLYNVTKIVVAQSELQTNDINVLEKFPTLLYLRLEINSYTTEEFRVKGFPNLKQLIISKCPIKTMSFEEGALPCLETLDLDLDDLELLSGLEYIPRLEKVFLRSNSEASRRVVQATQNVINKHTNNPKLLAFCLTNYTRVPIN